MESFFHDAQISHIVAFEHLNFEFNEENIDKLKDSIFFNTIPISVELKSLNKEIYSELFVKRYPDVLSITLKIDFLDFINETRNNEESAQKIKKYNSILECFKSYLSRNISIKICFDQIGISSARFDFKIDKTLKTSDLIKNADNTSRFVDEILFDELKNELLNKIPIKNENLLEVHDTYSVIISKNSSIDLDKNRKEILGIISLKKEYNIFTNSHVENKLDMFSLYEGSIIIVGYVATFMMFQNPERFTKNPDNYIEERITAVEIYHRQKNLLKKLDIELYDLIEDLENNFDDLDINGLKSKIHKIKEAQIHIQSKLEIYRNTRTLTTASFVTFFDILNDVFRMDKQYKFVLEKLDACDNVYQGLHNQIRNELMEDIQVIVAILGTLSLVLLFIDMIIDENGLIQLILIPIFISIIWILRKNTLNFYNILKEKF